MNFINELKKNNLTIRSCSIKSGIPYATLYPIIKGKTDIGTCSYYTVEKLANILGYRPDQIVYNYEDFQTFRNNLHHAIKRNELEVILNTIEDDEIEHYQLHEDYLKMFYLLATVDFLSKKNGVPLCDKYNEIRNKRLEEVYYVGYLAYLHKDISNGIEEFKKYNIIEGDLYDAV